MTEDNDLFKYELAIVAIFKNEAPYLKEWIDYHLLAGVDHFYLYDNESDDNFKEVLSPYIEKNLVDYNFYPGKCAQMATYNEAVKNYKFNCQYMAFIDLDEFILPKNNKSIKEVIKEILFDKDRAGGLAINWHLFGSSGHEKADFHKSVLERFIYRTPDNFDVDKNLGNAHIKTIANPRLIKFVRNPHFINYFESHFTINEIDEIVQLHFTNSHNSNKIVINHYHNKSKEEYEKKIKRGNADLPNNNYKMDTFYNIENSSTVYDDEIIKYVMTIKNDNPRGGGGKYSTK
ncbi:MAG: glycosyltransferase family 92 protein [Selenomonadaceae bacterium]|nr:glycosyltransferase family 92 protein [Selenomonadaceae bacterium]